MKHYKGMYIIRPDLTEEQTKTVVEEINKIFVDHNGTVLSVDEWGLKDMAYEIQDFRKGYYVVFTVEADAAAVEEFNRIANIREDIIRHIIIKEDD
ncbi:MAG TPA: 30S ribosomal protein S6 [Acholeplasmataceae bacterium]|jgi:small subunit ribosomal protein S6|nr:30S ribosomal protein S6 [Acholeplasmataceae bacterium]